MLPRLEYDRGAPRRIGFAIILALLLAAAATWWFGPSQRQHRRNSALWEACTKGDLQAAQDALAAGAEPNTRDKYGITPLMYAARGDRPDMANPPATDHPAIVQLLIKSGANVNSSTNSGFVALFWAARYGHVQAAKVLIDNGANVNAQDNTGATAVKWATTNQAASPPNYGQVIALLKAAGAKE
jgi:uncharacterized protein